MMTAAARSRAGVGPREHKKMTEVTDVLRDRRLEPGGFERMATVSVLVHGGLIALVLLAPGRWWMRDVAGRPACSGGDAAR